MILSSSMILASLLVFCPVCCAQRVVNATVGNQVTLPCHTNLTDPVDWRYQSHETVDDIFIFIAGNRGSYWPHHSRTELTAKGGYYNLTINNVTVNDTGMYTCIEDMGVGTKHHYWLQVYDPGRQSSNHGAKIGAIVTVVIVVSAGLVAFIIVFIIRKKRRQNYENCPVDERPPLKSLCCTANQECVAILFGYEITKMTKKHRKLLKGKKTKLVAIMDPTDNLLDELVNNEVFVERDKEQVSANQQYDEKVVAIIDILMAKPDSVFEKFITALCAAQQEDVASLLGHKMMQMSEEHRQLLTSKTEELVQCIDPTDTLLHYLVTSGALSNRNVNKVSSQANYEEKSRETINILLGKPDIVFDRFIQALRDSNHDHVAYILTGTGEPPLSPEHRKLLENTKSELATIMDQSDTLLHELVKNGVFVERDKQRVCAKQQCEEKIHVIIDILMRKTDTAFDKFIAALSTAKEEKYRQLLISKTEELIQSIDPTDTLLQSFVKNGVLSNSDVNKVTNKRSYEEKSREIIKILLGKPDIMFDKFIEALHDSDHDHVAYILTSEGDSPLSPEHRKLLENTNTKLVTIMDPTNKLLDELVNNGVFVERDKQRVCAKQQYEEKVAAIIEILMRKPDTAFDKFITALCTAQQEDVASLLGHKIEQLTEKHRQLLICKSKELCQFIDPTDTLLPCLVKNGAYSNRDVNKVPIHSSYKVASLELINILLGKPDIVFERFIQALRDSNQDHVAYILTGKGEPPLSPEHRNLMKNTKTNLVNIMDPTDSLLDKLVSKGVLVERDKQQVKAKQKYDEKVIATINILMRKPDSVFDKFITELCAAQQEDVAGLLGYKMKPLTEKHRNLLKDTKTKLVAIMDPTNKLQDELVNSGVFVERDKQRVCAKQQCEEKVAAIIEILMRKPDTAFDKFITALCAAQQEDVASLLGHKMIQMTEEHRQLINNNTEELIQFIDPTDTLLQCLVNNGALSNRNVNKVPSQANDEEKSREIINILLGKPDKAFDRFIQALRESDHDHVAFILTGKGEPPLSHVRLQVLQLQRASESNLFGRINLSDVTLISNLLSAGVINPNDKKLIDARLKVANKNAVGVLVDALSRKSDKTYDKLIHVLKQENNATIVANKEKGYQEIVNDSVYYEVAEMLEDVERGIHVKEVEDTVKRLQADIKECNQIKKREDTATFIAHITKKQKEWNQIPINIAIIGYTGVGKSSFINAIRGLKSTDPGAAVAHFNEQTRQINCYSHPEYPVVKFWDLPGVGTAQFPQNKYLELINVDRYDFFLLLTEKWQLNATESWLAKNITKRNKKFYFVRTKADLDCPNDKQLKEWRANIGQKLKDLECAVDTKTFLVSNTCPKRYQFEHLKISLTEDIPVLRDIAVLMNMKEKDGGCIIS